MRIAVTGGAGFVGTHLVAALLAHGHQVLVYDNLFARPRKEDLPWLHDVHLAEGSIVDAPRLRQELRAFAPEAIFHLAALHYIPYCDQHPGETLRVNVEGTLNVMLAAGESDALKAVLFGSSVAVYAPTDRCHEETDKPQPSDVYGLSKLLAERIVEQYARQLHLSHLALRFANLYGPSETNPHVVPAVLEQLLAGAGTLRLGLTDACRDFLYIGDLVDALLAALDFALRREVHETINLSAGQEWSVDEAVAILCDLSGRSVSVVRDEQRVRPVDRMHLRASIARARELLGWTPRHGLRAGLEKTFAWEREHRERRAAAAVGV
jgi:UDP-glucose 4-epimerase